jgi:hypothetical protein
MRGLNATFFSFFWFLINLVFYIKINIKKIQIHCSKFNTCTLIINYISKSCSSLLKKILKLQNFVSGVPHPIFSKNARILTVIFIGHRQLNNTYCGPAGPTGPTGHTGPTGPTGPAKIWLVGPDWSSWSRGIKASK